MYMKSLFFRVIGVFIEHTSLPRNLHQVTNATTRVGLLVLIGTAKTARPVPELDQAGDDRRGAFPLFNKAG